MSKLFTFKFCPSCGRKIKQFNEKFISCKFCSFHFYFTPYPTNALIIENDKGEILLVKRRSPPKKGYWDLPGGFVEFGENMEESMRREIKEELGIEVDDIHYINSAADLYLYKEINYHTLCSIYATKVVPQKMKSHDDITEICFFPKKKIPFSKIAFPGLTRALKIYLSSFHQPYSPKNCQQSG